MGSKVKIALVYGGKSGEHEVSLQTAYAVMGQFDFSQYEIIPFYITKQGEWRSGSKLIAPPQNVLRCGPASLLSRNQMRSDFEFARTARQSSRGFLIHV